MPGCIDIQLIGDRFNFQQVRMECSRSLRKWIAQWMKVSSLLHFWWTRGAKERQRTVRAKDSELKQSRKERARRCNLKCKTDVREIAESESSIPWKNSAGKRVQKLNYSPVQLSWAGNDGILWQGYTCLVGSNSAIPMATFQSIFFSVMAVFVLRGGKHCPATYAIVVVF